jgi:DNA-binding IclR family transcriptional regulator
MTIQEELTPLARLILRTIQDANGDWLSRKEIAQRIGRPKRSSYDIDVLNDLVQRGYLEERESLTGVVKTVKQYRSVK